ncbi:FapA family protein [Christensenellaceae bacterium OttesenSCG-928-K19]|nr:FapA family protein [Christensenellaceae bacterium OttesenSCG-928-K19]
MAEEMVVSHTGIKGLDLYYEEDGVYLQLGGGEGQADMLQMIGYIKRKKLEGADLGLISRTISGKNSDKVKVAEPQEELILDEEIDAEVDKYRMTAHITLFPCDIGGRELSKEDVLDELRVKYKVVSGINEELIDQLLGEKKYYEKMLIAEGKKAVNGVDAKLIYHFDIESFTNKAPKTVGEDEKINFREVNQFSRVNKGQKLVSRTVPTKGESGFDVCGTVVPAKDGVDVSFSMGKNLEYSEDGRALHSTIDGRLEFAEGVVSVSASVKINGDVDMTVGNIAFEGDVEVMGNVNAGFFIKANGNIMVHGLIESAELTSGGDIVCVNGISGADKAVLKAEGKVYAKYVERATIDAKESVTTEFALHSVLMSEGYVDVSKGKGAIIGGTVSAGEYVVAKSVGADSGTATSIEIGISPAKRNRYKEIQEAIPTYDAGLSRLKLALEAAANPNNLKSNPKAVAEVKVKLAELLKQRSLLTDQLAELEEAMQSAQDGQIHVADRVYPGTRIAIGACTIQIRQENRFVTYYREKKDIETMTYHFTPGQKQEKSDAGAGA